MEGVRYPSTSYNVMFLRLPVYLFKIFKFKSNENAMNILLIKEKNTSHAIMLYRITFQGLSTHPGISKFKEKSFYR